MKLEKNYGNKGNILFEKLVTDIKSLLEVIWKITQENEKTTAHDIKKVL